MKRLRQVVANVAICFMILFSAVVAGAEQTAAPSLIISEVKVRNDSVGYDEFIEFYNNSASSISLNDYYIEYFNISSPAAGQAPTAKAVISPNILPTAGYFILAKNPDQITDAVNSPFNSLADSGGKLQITDLNANTIDEVSWTSTAGQATGSIILIPSSSSSKSLTRSTDVNGVPIAVNHSWSLSTPTPQSDVLMPPEPEPEPDPEPAPEPEPAPDPTPVPDSLPEESPAGGEPLPAAIAQLQISELLPNPGPPVNDDEGEFIEIYNPNSETIDLDGYKLQAGNNFTYSFTFTDQSINAGSYAAYFASDTNLVLANSSGRTRLLNSGGQVISETTAYEDADDDTAWAMLNGLWQWTLTPTPNAANVLTLPTPVAASIKSSTKKAAAAKKPAAKTSQPKVKSAASSKSSKAKPSAAAGTDGEGQGPSPLHPSVLAGVGAAALLYGLYEYRQDIGNSIYKLKRYRALRRTGRGGA